MSNEEPTNSLADQAAAWVPPWERRPPSPTTPDAPATSEPPTPQDPPASRDTPATRDTPAPDATAAAPDQAAPPDQATPTGASSALVTAVGSAPTAPPTPAGPPGVDPDPSSPEPAAARTPNRGGRRGGNETRPAAQASPPMDEGELRGALEAILLVVDEPVSELTLAQVLEQPPARVGAMLDRIAAGYTAAGYGFELRRAAGGWRLYTRAEYAPYVERFVLDGQSVRLTQAALETLAVVAYRQPVTRSRISAIRGVNCDGVIRTLVSRGLVEECGTESDSGAFLYRTTTLFLEKLGLNSVDDLPSLAPFLPDDVEEFADATR